MTLSLDLRNIGDRCRSFYDATLPKGAKVKTLQRILGLSHASAEQLAGGRIPTTAHLAILARHFGRNFVDYVFADVAERPTPAELAEVAAIGRALNEQAVVALAPAPALAVVASPVEVRAQAGEPDRGEAGLAVIRRSLDVVAGRKSHLASHLRRWAESSGLAERTSLANMAKETPQHRLSILTDAGQHLIFNHISPAFRFYTQHERERLIGRPTTEQAAPAYVAACDRNFREVLATGKPAVDDVDAIVEAETGSTLRPVYRRAVFPYREGRQRFVLCASELLATAA